jgi:RNA polymerase sigma-70 factor (ECF subfamily)
MIHKEQYYKIIKSLQKLPDIYRDVFILHAIGEVKLKEIACIYKKTESWARVTYYRAKQQIAQEVMK